MTDGEVVGWLLDGAKESAEAEWDVVITDDLLDSWAQFKDAVMDSLIDANDAGIINKDDLESIDMMDQPEVVLDIYHTITGAGVSIDDGRWDHLFAKPNTNGNVKATKLAKFLRAHKNLAKFAEESGGGSFHYALDSAVFDAKPYKRRSMARRKSPNPTALIKQPKFEDLMVGEKRCWIYTLGTVHSEVHCGTVWELDALHLNRAGAVNEGVITIVKPGRGSIAERSVTMNWVDGYGTGWGRGWRTVPYAGFVEPVQWVKTQKPEAAKKKRRSMSRRKSPSAKSIISRFIKGL